MQQNKSQTLPQTSQQQILVINCGSSSIKYALINPQNPKARLQGLAEKLGSDGAVLKGKNENGESFEQAIPNANHEVAVQAILKCLGDKTPTAIGHRVVHGGETFTGAVPLNAEVMDVIEKTSALAPLHNPANIIGILATKVIFPDLPQVGVFDTAFHQTMPEKAYRYAIPAFLYRDYGIRRYGFHGSSHAYVSHRAIELTSPAKKGWLSAHLGNGCSSCAIWEGKSVDTSMGLTPLEGLVMGTRCGDLDPGLHAHLNRELGWDLAKIDQVLNKESGLLGLSELSNDMRTLEQAASDGNENAILAIEVFCYRLAKSLAALSCGLPQLHGIIFTGGIGENAPLIRQKTMHYLSLMRVQLDVDANQNTIRGKEGRIDNHQVSIADNDAVQVWVIPTDEEWQIAHETIKCLQQHTL